MQKVGRGTHDACNPKVNHHGNQLLGISGGHGNYGSPQFLRPVVGSKTSRKQAVAVGHLDDVLLSKTCHGNAPGHTLAPDIDIPACVAHHRGLSCRSAGSMDSGNLGIGNREHAEGIGLPQIVLGGKRKLIQILNSLDISRFQT